MANVKKKSAGAEGTSLSEEKKVLTVVYIGPTVRKIALPNSRIFRNGLSAECNKLLAVVPGAKHLFVSIADYAEATKRLTDKTSVEAVMYSRVVDVLKELK